MKLVSDPITVLVIDDEPAHRELCRLAVADEPDLRFVGQAHSAMRGAELAERLQPDVIVLDLSMPVMDGFEAMPLLKRLSPTASIVIWSSADEYLLRRAMGMGAVAFVPKLAPAQRLVDAIHGTHPSRHADDRVISMIAADPT